MHLDSCNELGLVPPPVMGVVFSFLSSQQFPFFLFPPGDGSETHRDAIRIPVLTENNCYAFKDKGHVNQEASGLATKLWTKG